MAITETRSLPPQFVEDLGKDYATQLTGLTSQALDTYKISTQWLLVKTKQLKTLTQGQQRLVKVLEHTHHT